MSDFGRSQGRNAYFGAYLERSRTPENVSDSGRIIYVFKKILV